MVIYCSHWTAQKIQSTFIADVICLLGILERGEVKWARIRRTGLGTKTKQGLLKSFQWKPQIQKRLWNPLLVVRKYPKRHNRSIFHHSFPSPVMLTDITLVSVTTFGPTCNLTKFIPVVPCEQLCGHPLAYCCFYGEWRQINIRFWDSHVVIHSVDDSIERFWVLTDLLSGKSSLKLYCVGYIKMPCNLIHFLTIIYSICLIYKGILKYSIVKIILTRYFKV